MNYIVCSFAVGLAALVVVSGSVDISKSMHPLSDGQEGKFKIVTVACQASLPDENAILFLPTV